MPADVVIPALIISAVLAVGAATGGVVGMWLSRQSRTQRRRGLAVASVIAVISPILHSAALIVWAGLFGTLAAYVVGRRRSRPAL